jgi:GT2 family glycosyltransferase
MRRNAFLEVGGYHQRFHIGAEEPLLALDLAQAGWEMRYLDEIVVHHFPSVASRFPAERRHLVMRNLVWTAWLRGSAHNALKATLKLMRDALHDRIARAAFCDALSGMPWILRERRPVSPHVQRSFKLMREPAS